MTGAFLNAIGILLGSLFGLAVRPPLSLRVQIFFRSALGVATIFFGLRLVWISMNGTFWQILKQTGIALLAIFLGHILGKLLQLQKISNRLGRYANAFIVAAQSGKRINADDGFKACAILFCAAPLGLMGAVTDGLSDYFWLLLIKAVMDGLAMTAFVKVFRWPAAMSAFPVFVWLGGITLLCHSYLAPFLQTHGGTDSVNATMGFITCAVALVIFEVRKVPLANYLPALAIAPLLTCFFK